MPREWYVIVGLAKTGTTAVAMTLRNTLANVRLVYGPNDSATIEQFAACERLVIKIIFDHWRTRVDALHVVLSGEPSNRAQTVIAIVRDPRDEAVSRLHYTAYDYFPAGRPRPTIAPNGSRYSATRRRRRTAFPCSTWNSGS